MKIDSFFNKSSGDGSLIDLTSKKRSAEEALVVEVSATKEARKGRHVSLAKVKDWGPFVGYKTEIIDGVQQV